MRRPGAFVLCSVIFALKADLVNALYAHNTTCTLPEERNDFTFVQDPNVRGTLQIAWTCLFTLFVCCYQVLHLNVPPLRADGKPSGQFWLTIWWALVVVVAPEFILVESICDLHDARKSLRELRQTSGYVEGSWTLTHMFYANMGGFVVRHTEQGDLKVRGDLIKTFMDEGLIDSLPPLSKEEIMDKSKDDPYTKALAILQIAYFYVEFALRFVQKLPVSQMELAVASVAAYAFISYICLLHKPKNVGVATLISAVEEDLQDKLETMTVANLSFLGDNHDAEKQDPKLDWRIASKENIASLGRFWQQGSDSRKFGMVLVFILFSAPLGAVHMVAWTWHFPTVYDMWLWRICSLAATAAGIALILIGFVQVILSIWWENSFLVFGMPMGLLMVACYVLARFTLIAEMIRCLFYLEPRTFLGTNWVLSIPHIG